MHAAVVRAFDTPPSYEDDFPGPVARDADQLVVSVIASGLHPRVRSQADGSHYTSTAALPLVPGIDGVGRDAHGRLRYFILPDTTLGAMAEQTLIDPRRSVVLPESTDGCAVAAGMNPAMSSWLALRQRISFAAGQSVLVLGATGNAGRLAVQVATSLGAGRVVGVARDAAGLGGLPALGATDTVLMGGADYPGRLGTAAHGVDVVLDYLWGQPAADAMAAIVADRADRSAPLSWVQIGSVAGPTAPIPSAALRAARLQLVGSGQGSVGTRQILAELPELAGRLTDGTLAVHARPVPLAEVGQAWAAPTDAGRRIVLTP